MSESGGRMCAARVSGAPCQNAGTHEKLETHDVHERHWFFLCDTHLEAWDAGQLDLEKLVPSRVVSYTE